MDIRLAGILVAVVTAGCSSLENTHPYVQRFDNQPIASAVLEQATVECDAKSRVAGGMTPNTYGPAGLGPAMDGVKSMGVRHHAYTACMAEKGMRVTYGPPPAGPITGSIQRPE